MLHPSYTELMDQINSREEEPIVNSRYSVVIAAAKRARQLINGAGSDVENFENKKPLSVAVEELMSGSVKIISGAENEDDDIILSGSDQYSLSIEEDENYEDEDADVEDSDDEEEESENGEDY